MRKILWLAKIQVWVRNQFKAKYEFENCSPLLVERKGDSFHEKMLFSLIDSCAKPMKNRYKTNAAWRTMQFWFRDMKLNIQMHFCFPSWLYWQWLLVSFKVDFFSIKIPSLSFYLSKSTLKYCNPHLIRGNIAFNLHWYISSRVNNIQWKLWYHGGRSDMI